MNKILIKNGTIITMNSNREIIEKGNILIEGNKISKISKDQIPVNDNVNIIDAKNKVVMPGLIDSHGHAGHSIIKTLGTGNSQDWINACLQTYAKGSTLNFWKADAALSSLEKLKSGVTSSLILFGGGTDLIRADDTIYAESYANEYKKTGVRTHIAVGPNRPPYPQEFFNKETNQTIHTSVDHQIDITKELVSKRNRKIDDKVSFCLSAPKFFPNEMDDKTNIKNIEYIYDSVMDLRSKYGVIFTQDGHKEGSVAITDRFGGLDEWSLLSHSIDLTKEDLDSIYDKNPTIVHNPSSNYSIMGRCPAPELIEKGVRVVIGSDGAAPDRGFDMFRHMSQCMHYHRTFFKDTSIMPPGKVLEMVTIDSAKGFGLEDSIGSIETNKIADIILIDMFKPHLIPMNMPVSRLTYYANAADVDTVLVDGEIVMQNRIPTKINENEILEFAENESNIMIKENNFEKLMDIPDNFWRKSKL